MSDFNEQPTEAEALQFKKEHDDRVAKIREDMGYKKAEVEATVVETEVETPVEETEIEEVETPEEEVETTEEIEEEADETETTPESQNRDKSVFRQLNEIRSQKRTIEAEKAKVLEDYNKVLEENKTLKANQPPPQPFVDFAKSKGIQDPKDVKEMYDLFRSELDKDFGSKITALDEKIKQFDQKESERAEEGAYNDSMAKLSGEWAEVLPIIESEYKPSSTQVEQAFTLMADLAHEAKYHDKELDYILFKESPKFEEIFGARRRRTMFPSKGRATASEGKQPLRRDGSHESIMALRKEQQAKMHGADGFDVVENGEIV